MRKKTLEDNDYNLRKVTTIPAPARSGPSGASRTKSGWWRRTRTIGTRVCLISTASNFINLIPFSPELGSAILSNRVDYVRITDPVTARKAKATPGMSTTAFNQSVIQGTWVNSKKKPFDDPRVRRACIWRSTGRH